MTSVFPSDKLGGEPVAEMGTGEDIMNEIRALLSHRQLFSTELKDDVTIVFEGGKEIGDYQQEGDKIIAFRLSDFNRERFDCEGDAFSWIVK